MNNKWQLLTEIAQSDRQSSVVVSTVKLPFIAISRNQLKYETAVFRNDSGEVVGRYKTVQEATNGHWQVVQDLENNF